MTVISQKNRFWGHPQKRLCIVRKFCVRFSSIFALILRIAFIFVRKRQGPPLPHGKRPPKKKKPTPFVWRGHCFSWFKTYRSLRVQVSSGKIISSTSPLLRAKCCIIPHASFPMICWQYSTFLPPSQGDAGKFHKQFTYFCEACVTHKYSLLMKFSTSYCGNWRNHGESIGFPSLFPCSLYIFSLAFGMLPML